MSAIAAEKPTVFCLEDLHWADTAGIDLLRAMLAEFGSPSILLCTYRPQFSLFTSDQSEALGAVYREIRLSELSPSEATDMMESLLDSGLLPLDLIQLIRDRAEGNPFYLEEMVNALIDAGALIYSQDQWQLKRAFLETDVPSTIHGVIASRLDQFSLKARRVLQEASVAGRAFLYDILKRISVYSDGVEDGLYELERSGLVHTRALHPEMEFMFKHALIQEVGYSSLLRKERQQVHERIAQVMEQLFSDRLSAARFDLRICHGPGVHAIAAPDGSTAKPGAHRPGRSILSKSTEPLPCLYRHGAGAWGHGPAGALLARAGDALTGRRQPGYGAGRLPKMHCLI